MSGITIRLPREYRTDPVNFQPILKVTIKSGIGIRNPEIDRHLTVVVPINVTNFPRLHMSISKDELDDDLVQYYGTFLGTIEIE
jgi:hypothetical protein